MMRVSVVMPVYNAAPTVARALESVITQSYPVDEIIVVDDGSDDDSVATVRRVGGARVTVVGQARGGPARARNAGIARATGDIVVLLDADDWWDPTKVARQVTVFEQHPEVVATASNWRWHEASAARGRDVGRLSLPSRACGRVLRGAGADVLRLAFAMTSSTLAARRDVLERHRFDEGLATAEDRDVWVRIVADGPVWFDATVLATITRSAHSQSHASTDRDCACMIEVLGRHAHLAGRSTIRRLEARTYAKWAGRLLAEGRAAEASVQAWRRWQREWWQPQAWWVLAKCRWKVRNENVNGAR